MPAPASATVDGGGRQPLERALGNDTIRAAATRRAGGAMPRRSAGRAAAAAFEPSRWKQQASTRVLAKAYARGVDGGWRSARVGVGGESESYGWWTGRAAGCRAVACDARPRVCYVSRCLSSAAATSASYGGDPQNKRQAVRGTCDRGNGGCNPPPPLPPSRGHTGHSPQWRRRGEPRARPPPRSAGRGRDPVQNPTPPLRN